MTYSNLSQENRRRLLLGCLQQATYAIVTAEATQDHKTRHRAEEAINYVLLALDEDDSEDALLNAIGAVDRLLESTAN
jgi:hypothetical protein